MKAKTQESVSAQWPMVRLGDVCEEIRSRIPSSKVTLDGYITTDNMLKGCAGVVRAESLPEGVGLVEYTTDDVLVSNIRPYLKKAWLANHDGGCSSDVIVFRSLRTDLSPDYLFAALSADAFFDFAMQNVSGTKMPRGKRDWIKQYEFPLPPLVEQKRIVAKLEKELARVEAMKAKFERMATAAENVFKATLAEAFEGLENETDGTTGTNGTLGRMVTDVAVAEVTDVADVPSPAARRVRLGEVCEDITDGDHQPPPKVESGVPFLVISNVATGQISFENTRYVPRAYYDTIQDKRKPKRNDVLFTVTGSYGIPLIVDTDKPFCFQRHIALLRTSPKSMTPKFLRYFLLSSKRYFDDVATGTAQKTVSLNSLREMKVSLPPLPVQRSIVSRLDAAKARSEGIAAKARAGVATCEKLRKALLAEAFAGEGA